MKSLTNIAQIIIIVIIAVLFSYPTIVAAQADDVQAADSNSANIVGGTPADQGEWGWQVLVRPGNYLCGGSLIAEDWVVTAAHCVFNSQEELIAAETIHVTVGETYRGTLEGTEQQLDVDAIFAHEAYDHSTNSNDIALLHLVKPVVMNKAIAIISLLTNEQLDLVAPGKLATVTGWGTTKEGGYASSSLMEVTVPIVDNATCNSSYGIIGDNMLCAGYAEGGKDSCQGDSGGPLVVPDEAGNWYLAGIVSFGYGCARADYYGVYTRVSSLVEWVQGTMTAYASTHPAVVVEPMGDNDTSANVEQSVTAQIVFIPVVMR